MDSDMCSLFNNVSISPKASKFQRKPLKKFLRKLGMERYFSKFNKSDFFWVFMNTPVVMLDFVPDDFEMPPYKVQEMELFLQWWFHMNSYVIPHTDLTLTLYESFELTRRFDAALPISFNEGTQVYAMGKKWIDAFEHIDAREMATEQLMKGMLIVTLIRSSMSGWIYGSDLSVSIPKNDKLKMRFKMTIARKKPELYNREGKHLRRYYRLEYGNEANEFITKECTYEGETYPVYLQQHALKRIEERLTLSPHAVYYQLTLNIDFCDVRTYRGSIFIPYCCDGHKLGYLVGEFHDNLLLINTFLFLSQDGTPEGDKLNELLKVKKLEKEYLQLDELRYFTNSDLKDDEELLPILKICQLDHLFKLRIRIPEIDFTENADFIKTTLQFDGVA